ncbi:hypothetical protein [Amycolatopsis eburnea]|nr:hypothetical protein [Amycolatopsis eburnea]
MRREPLAGHLRARGRAPRPWAGALQRPAAKILVAGGLTLAGWLLTAALSGSTAGAVEQAACPQAPVASTVDHPGKPFLHGKHHRKSHRETGACAQQPGETAADPAGTTTTDTTAGETQPANSTAADTAPAGTTAADSAAADTTPSGTTATNTTAGEAAPSDTTAGDTQPANSTAADTTPSETVAGETNPAETTPSGTTASQTTATESTPTETTPVDSAAADTTATGTKPAETAPAAKTPPSRDTTAAEQPAADTQSGLLGGLVGNVLNASTETQPQTGLLGGLVGGVLNVVGGALTTVTSTVGVVTDTLSHTVLAPLTQPPASNPDAPVLLPLDDVLGPIFTGGSNSGGVTVTAPAATTLVATVPAETPAAAVVTAPVEAAPQSTSRGATHSVVVRHEVPQQAKQELPRDSGVHARDGGGDTAPGLPGGTTAPSAPAPTATPGHDGPGGARHAFAVHTDDVTTTQLKLIGASRDHDVDGAGREAALPTTSPD